MKRDAGAAVASLRRGSQTMLPQRFPALHDARGAGAAPGGADDLACTERPSLLVTGARPFFHGVELVGGTAICIYHNNILK